MDMILSSEAERYTPEDQGITLKSLAAHATLFANDLKYVHVHCVGEKFQEMHGILQGYYEKALEEADFFMEQGVIAGEGAVNPSLALSNVSFPWEPEKREVYEYEDYIRFLWDKGKAYIEALYGTGEAYGRVVSAKVDEYLEHWVTEIEYKLAAQGVTEAQGPDYEASREAAEYTISGMFQENYKGIR